MEPLNKLDCRWNLLRSFRVEEKKNRAPAGFRDYARNDEIAGQARNDGWARNDGGRGGASRRVFGADFI